MSILIKRLFGEDMPMPQEGFVDIRIHFKSGKLRYVTMPTGENPFYATFEVEKLPPHERLINADKLMMSLADWWYSSFGQTETEESKAIKTVLDKIENSIAFMGANHNEDVLD